MNRNLTPATYPDAVQRPLTFEAGESALNGLPLRVQSFPGRSFLGAFHQLTVRSVRLNNGLSRVLPPYQVGEFAAGISGIRHDIVRLEFAVRKSRLTQYVRRPRYIMDIASTHIDRHRQFRLTVNKHVEFVAKYKLILAVRVLLNRPLSILIGIVGFLSAVTPCFQRRGIKGDTLAETRQFVATPYQRTRHILYSRQEARCRQPFEESAECSLVSKPQVLECPASQSHRY